MIVGALVVLCGMVLYLLPGHRTISLPQKILQLQLTEEIAGTRAENADRAIFGQLAKPEDHRFGIYFSTDGVAKLNVSLYPSAQVADEQFKDLLEKTLKRDTIFSQWNEFILQNEKVYQCQGYGQAQYFFRSGDALYWWSADTQIARSSIEELIRILKSQNK